jgi:phosphoenolpyruvate-protein kinase (PTS system EI component)
MEETSQSMLAWQIVYAVGSWSFLAQYALAMNQEREEVTAAADELRLGSPAVLSLCGQTSHAMDKKPNEL